MSRRVLVIVQNLSVPSDRRVWLECTSLRRAGYTVSVICPRARGEAKRETIDGVGIHRYAPPPASNGVLSFVVEFVYCWLQTARLAVKIAFRPGFDVVQACNPPDTYFALAVILRLFGKKFVFDQHDLCPELYVSRFAQPSPPLLRMLRSLERATYRAADHVISTNESYRRVAMTRGQMPGDQVTVVRTGPDPNRMRRGTPKPALRSGRQHLCCYLGVMGPQDGVDLAVRAAAELVHKLGRTDCHFALLGSGDVWAEIRALVDELEVGAYVTMPGRVSDTDLFAYLSTADIGLCPDPLNALNDVSTMNKTMEYMAFELPVVSFDLTETKVSAGDAAMYVPANDVTAFASAIDELLDDCGRRASMGASGRRRVEDVLAWEHQAPAYVSVYDRLCLPNGSTSDSDETSNRSLASCFASTSTSSSAIGG